MRKYKAVGWESPSFHVYAIIWTGRNHSAIEKFTKQKVITRETDATTGLDTIYIGDEFPVLVPPGNYVGGLVNKRKYGEKAPVFTCTPSKFSEMYSEIKEDL